ncbi:hypothetical protein [Aquimarina agarivorans]|uniref:hypothetical protein n=1 Tax=Aquimarina agarivorans TaxID=980584 RepID=UPI0004964A01|nr:hypothetical protein [Aquimarina agarivorans]
MKDYTKTGDPFFLFQVIFATAILVPLLLIQFEIYDPANINILHPVSSIWNYDFSLILCMYTISAILFVFVLILLLPINHNRYIGYKNNQPSVPDDFDHILTFFNWKRKNNQTTATLLITNTVVLFYVFLLNPAI